MEMPKVANALFVLLKIEQKEKNKITHKSKALKSVNSKWMQANWPFYNNFRKKALVYDLIIRLQKFNTP